MRRNVVWLLPADQCAVVGANVRALRLGKGWSQRHLGELMGWRDGTAVCRIEGQDQARARGRSISVDELELLADIFRLPAWRLKHRCVNCDGRPPTGFACLACGARREAEPGHGADTRQGGEHAREPALSPVAAAPSPGPWPDSPSAPPAAGSRRRRPGASPRAAALAKSAGRGQDADSRPGPGPVVEPVTSRRRAGPGPALAAHRLDGRGPLLPPEAIGGSGAAPWMPVARAAAAAIAAGRYEPGRPLSWRDLAREQGAAEGPARRALSELLALGYAVRQAGRIQVAADAVPAPLGEHAGRPAAGVPAAASAGEDGPG